MKERSLDLLRASLLVILVIAVSITLTIKAGAQQSGQTEQTPAQPRPAQTPVFVSPESDYRIGPRDVIEIAVEDAPELSCTRDVSAAGNFLMPYLGQMRATGKSPSELAKEIAEGLKGRYLKDPRVNVTIKAYNSRSFLIMGSVRQPGVYQIEGDANLFELIVLAGGLVEPHSAHAFVIRKNKQEAVVKEASTTASTDAADESGEGSAASHYEMIKVNIKGLLKGYFDQNRPLKPGDIVNIPPSDIFFVAGEVNFPGQFPLKEGITLRQAVSLARGLKYEAAKDRGIIFRENEKTGEQEQIKVDIGAIMSGKAEDMRLMANDVIIVPGSKWKTLSGAMLKGLGVSGFGRGMPLP